MSDIARIPQHPAEVLIDLLITLLTPMFLFAAGGDLAFARLAAAEALDSYRAETHADLITVAKIIAFGLATLGSLSLSMANDLTTHQILRLRNSANATDRSEHRNRVALNQSQTNQSQANQSQTQQPVTPPEPEIDAAALTAAAAEMQQRTTENLARFSPSSPAPTDAQQQYQATLAASAATVAAETAASLASLSPQERRSAALWIDVLNDAAKDFMSGNPSPRPRPGDLAALMRGA
jgi:hypothetical protein